MDQEDRWKRWYEKFGDIEEPSGILAISPEFLEGLPEKLQKDILAGKYTHRAANDPEPCSCMDCTAGDEPTAKERNWNRE